MSNFYNIFLKNGLNAIEFYAQNGLISNYSLAFPSTPPTDNDVLVWDTTTSAFEWVDSSFFGVGTVTSVGLSAPNVFTVSNSPVNSSGNLTLGWVNQAANLVLASPASATGQPTFRSLVDSDLPGTISASKISGQLAKSNIPGGTVATTFQLNNNNGVILSNDAAGTALKLFDNTGATLADLYVKNLFVSGNVDQITTTTVNLGDTILKLNANFSTGTPSENAGLSVRRGTQNDADLLWLESTDVWVCGANNNLKPIARREEKTIVNADLSSNIYVFNHGLGVLPIVQVISDTNEITGLKIVHTNASTCSIDFSRVGSLTGSWRVIAIG